MLSLKVELDGDSIGLNAMGNCSPDDDFIKSMERKMSAEKPNEEQLRRAWEDLPVCFLTVVPTHR